MILCRYCKEACTYVFGLVTRVKKDDCRTYALLCVTPRNVGVHWYLAARIQRVKCDETITLMEKFAEMNKVR